MKHYWRYIATYVHPIVKRDAKRAARKEKISYSEWVQDAIISKLHNLPH